MFGRRSRASVCHAPLGLVIAALVMGSMPSAAVAADPPHLVRRAASPTRSGEAKGTGTPVRSQPTGRLIVRYRHGASQATRARVRAAQHAALVSRVALPDAELLAPVGGASQTMARLATDPDVLSVEPEYRRSLEVVSASDPGYGQQWSLNNSGQVVNGFAGVKDVDMNVPEAWQITTGSPSLVVAVIDDGVDFSDADLADRAWVNPGEIAGNGLDDDADGLVDDINGWDFCNDDSSLHDPDDYHGTHVAGTIAASANGVGVVGVAPSVQIMALKFIDGTSSCGTDTQAIAAIDYAVAHGARIINASWGGSDNSATLKAAIAAVPNTLLIAAAGNNNTNNDDSPIYPASYGLPNILSVASVHNQGFLSASSNFGPTSVDLSAPGEDVLSTLPGDTYGLLTGTSMAAANASGVAALAASAMPTLLGDAAALRTHLIATAKALPSTLGWVANARLLDARAAVVDRPDIRRLAGVDRYATAAAISAATFTPYQRYLFIAAGASFPDALAGGAVAAQFGFPVLLTAQSKLPVATLTEIQRLKPTDIFVLGGTAVVSDAVLQRLAGFDDPTSQGPFRLSGADRYATAAAISRAAFDPGVDPVPTAFIAAGTSFPDALAGVPATSVLPGPLLLTRGTSLPGATRDELIRLHPDNIVIFGGTVSVADNVAVELDGLTAGTVTRISGNDRYETAGEIARQEFNASATVYVAAGRTFPDALAGGPAAGAYVAPLLLVFTSSTPAATVEQLRRLQPSRIFVVGGTSVISSAVVTQIQALFP